MKRIVSGAYGVNISFPNGATIVPLPVIPQLRNKRIKYISVISPAQSLFLTLTEQNTQVELVKNVPLSLLGFGNDPIFINKIVDLENSYIDATKHNLGGHTLHMTFWYDEPKAWGFVGEKQRTKIIPLEIKLTGKRTYFEPDVRFKNIKIQNLILSFPQTTPNGETVFNKMGYTGNLTLAKDGFEFIKNVPLSYFEQSLYSDELRLQNISFDIDKSFIEKEYFTSPNDEKSFFFNVVADANK